MIIILILSAVGLVIVLAWAFRLMEKNNAHYRAVITRLAAENESFKRMTKRK